MPTKSFTDGWVGKLKPVKAAGQVDYFERLPPGRSLILTVGAARKTWSVQFYVNGKARRKKLGYFEHSDHKFPKLNCNQAREAVRDFDVKKEITRVKAGTFGEVAERWVDRHASKLRSFKELRRHLDSHILPAWRDWQFADVRRSDVNDLLDKIEDGHGPKAADAVLATVRSIMSWQQARDDNYTSAIVPGMKRDTRKPDERQRKRILNDDEIREVWKAAGEAGPFGVIVKLCLLTGQRKSKVAQMQMSDVDDETGIWTIRTESGEKGNPGTLKLPQIVLDLIDEARALKQDDPVTHGSPFVFPATRIKQARAKPSEMWVIQWRPFNSWSQRKAELDEKLPAMEPWVIHDLRRTCRSLMARLGIADHIAERVLGHKQPGVAGTYNRFRYEEEMAKALARVAAEIGRILKPGAKIVKLRG